MFEDAGLFLWWIICTWLIASIFLGIHDALKEANQELTLKLHKHIDSIVHRVTVVEEKNVYYWYDMDNNKFLAQGSSDEEIINNLKSQYPTHLFFLPTNHIISAKTDWQPKQIKQ